MRGPMHRVGHECDAVAVDLKRGRCDIAVNDLGRTGDGGQREPEQEGTEQTEVTRVTSMLGDTPSSWFAYWLRGVHPGPHNR